MPLDVFLLQAQLGSTWLKSAQRGSNHLSTQLSIPLSVQLYDASQSDYLLLLSYPMVIFSANLYRILKQDLVLPRAFSLHFSLLGLLLVCLLLYWLVLGLLLLIIDGRGRRLTSSQNSPALLRRCSNVHLHTYLKAFS